jgi:Tropinone reductase 1
MAGHDDVLVSTQWLAEHLGVSDQRIVDCLDKPEFRAGVLARTPSGRVGQPQDVAVLAAFLCLPAAAYVTGQCVSVDGGFRAVGFWPGRGRS